MAEKRGVFSLSEYVDRNIEGKTDSINDVWIVSDVGQPHRYGENVNDFQLSIPLGGGWGNAIGIGTDPNVIVVGDTLYSEGSISNAGAAYIYNLNGEKISRLTIEGMVEGDANANFGKAVAIGEGRIFIGQNDKIHIFNGGITEEILDPGSTDDGFGAVMAVGSGKLVVGTPLYSTNGGRVVIYDLNPPTGTIAESAIYTSTASSRSYYGISVAVGDNLIVAGAGGLFPGGDYISSNGYARIISPTTGNAVGYLSPDLSSSEAEVAHFGYSVAIGNGKIAVGAPKFGKTLSPSVPSMGAVYVFDQDGSNRIRITPSNGRIGDNFGTKVEIKNNKLIVSAPLRDHEKVQFGGNSYEGANQGSIYIYNLDGTGEYEIKYPGPSDSLGGIEFGANMSTIDNYLLVSATDTYAFAPEDRRIYCYDLNGIVANTNRVVPSIDESRDRTGLRDIQKEIRSSDGSTDDYFGYSVASGSNKIVVGAWGEDQNSYNSSRGAAYVYNLDGTGEIKITQPSPHDLDIFGWQVAVGNNKMVISERNDELVHIYDLDGSNVVTIQDPSGSTGDSFGNGVAIGGNKVFVGSLKNHYSGGTTYYDAGDVNVFNLDGTFDFRIIPSDQNTLDYRFRQFGQAIAINDGKVAIGADIRTSGITASNYGGKVYIYDIDGSNEVIITRYSPGFGRAVALGYNKVFIGAPYSNRVFIYNLDGTFDASISAFDIVGSDSEFGTSVAVGYNKLFVGAPKDDYNDGAFYVFNLDGTGGYKIPNTLNVDDVNIGGDKFMGQSITVEGNTVIVGAYQEGNFRYKVHAGSVFTYNIDDLDRYNNDRNIIL